MPRGCVFCGSTGKMTGEHTFSDWIGTLYPKDGRRVRIVILTPGQPDIEYKRRPFSEVANCVCEACNNGWMERLESRVRPFLGPMILTGERTLLSPAMQAALATWAVKTAFILQKAQPTADSVPESEYHAFYAEQQPQRGVYVWIGWRDSIGDSTGKPAVAQAFHATVPRITREPRFAESMERQSASGSRAYRITFGVDHIAFQVFGHTYRQIIAISHRPEYEQRLWPVEGSIAWPPPLPIDRLGGIVGWHQDFLDSD